MDVRLSAALALQAGGMWGRAALGWLARGGGVLPWMVYDDVPSCEVSTLPGRMMRMCVGVGVGVGVIG